MRVYLHWKWEDRTEQNRTEETTEPRFIWQNALRLHTIRFSRVNNSIIFWTRNDTLLTGDGRAGRMNGSIDSLHMPLWHPTMDG